MTVNWGIWGIVGFLIALIVATVGDLVSEELRGRLDRMPYAVLRLAIRRLPAEIRQSVGDEWRAELHHILHRAKGLPITRFASGIPYALGLLRTARRIGRELKAVRTVTSHRPASGLSSFRRVALVGGMTVSFATTVGVGSTIEATIGGGIIAGGVAAATNEIAGPNGAVTFNNPYAFTGRGPRIGNLAKVQISCMVYDHNAPASVQPGWWYRIASAPWKNHYYAPANTFHNGDKPGYPPVTDTNFEVPLCSDNTHFPVPPA